MGAIGERGMPLEADSVWRKLALRALAEFTGAFSF
jgi:hypothetical protein